MMEYNWKEILRALIGLPFMCVALVVGFIYEAACVGFGAGVAFVDMDLKDKKEPK